MTEEIPKRRRWFQFRLRTPLIAILVLSLPLSWFAVRMEKARRQREAVETIEGPLRGSVLYTREMLPAGARQTRSSWLRAHLGNDFFDEVLNVDLGNGQAPDAGLELLKSLRNLKRLGLFSTNVTDDGLEHLKGLTSLEFLNLYKVQFTDAGLVHLKGLTNLKELYIRDAQITDAGLEYLTGLTNLQFLALGSSVTPEGVKKLQEALPNCEIEY
jgi:Leucine-rich repeat (LRR) protein